MKLLQINVWMGRLSRQLATLIERENPDIITAQEVFSSDGMVGLPDNTFHILDIMKQSGRYEHSYFSPFYEAEYAGVTVGCGNAILSKQPFATQDTFFTHGELAAYDKAAVFESNIRNAQHVTIELPGKQLLHIINHHGYWEPDPVGSEKSVRSMQVVVDAIQKLSGAIVFAGDLNVNPNTPAMQLFDGLLEDLTGRHNITNTMSILGKLQGVAPDHILVNGAVHTQDFRVLDDLASDHLPLVLEFDV